MSAIAPNPLQGAAAATRFLRSYWQRRPALIRAALSPGPDWPTLDQVLALAQDDAVESRLVTWTRAGSPRLVHGPFEPRTLPSLKQRQWTVLVQGVDLHLDQGRALIDRFRFVPDVRLDDLMISVAGDRGGVGAHVDEYDVFLLQLAGRRHWRIEAPRTFTLRADAELKLIEDFAPQEEAVLEPGDMLYLPPGWAHEGTAAGACMTASVGWRAPSPPELRSAWLQAAADALADRAGSTANGKASAARYRDRLTGSDPSAWARHPARLPDAMHRTLARWLIDWRPNAREVTDFVGRHLTEPKASVWFERPSPRSINRFEADARTGGIVLDRKSRMAWRGRSVWINGEAAIVSGAGPDMRAADMRIRAALRALADERSLDAEATARLLAHEAAGAWLRQWHAQGWIHAAGRTGS